jgi:homoserine dehydrogenase
MMLRALENGKSVVTANKMALCLHFDELRAMAKRPARGCTTKPASAARSRSSTRSRAR